MSTEYRVETLQGFYHPAEKLGPYSFSEKLNCSYHGAKVYDRVEANRAVKKLRKAGLTTWTQETKNE